MSRLNSGIINNNHIQNASSMLISQIYDKSTIITGNYVIRLQFFLKVEKILKGSLDLIPSPSPSVKIQIMGEKVCLRCKGKTLLDVVKNFWKQREQCFALLPQVYFPTNNLNFHWRWWDWIQAFFLNLFYFIWT